MELEIETEAFDISLVRELLSGYHYNPKTLVSVIAEKLIKEGKYCF